MTLRSDPANVERTSNYSTMGNNRLKNGTLSRGQIARTQSTHVTDGNVNGDKKSASLIRDSRFLDSYSHSHGVITASAYKDLRNGTIRW